MKLTPPEFWHKKGLTAYALMPLSGLYQLLVKADKALKQRKKYRPNIPIISVGNITVGGSGKTPIVAMLAEHFTNKGEKVAILSRGYGGTHKDAHQIVEKDTPAEVGDEPRMLFSMGIADQTWVGADRTKTAKLAFERGATIIILDDGFQNWKLPRDVDIVVVGESGFGNACTLPSGPLREPLKNIRRAHMAIVPEDTILPDLKVPTVRAKRQPHTQDITPLFGRDILPFCGIGNPVQFFEGLKTADLQLAGRKAYPDHHMYTDEDCKWLINRSGELRAQLVTTPKDAEKLPKEFLKRCRIVRPDFDQSTVKDIIQRTERALKKNFRK